MHSAGQVLGRMFNLFSFASPMSSSFIEIEVVLNISYMVVKLSVGTISVVKAGFLSLRAMSGGPLLSWLFLLLRLGLNKGVYGLSQRGHGRLVMLLTLRKGT